MRAPRVGRWPVDVRFENLRLVLQILKSIDVSCLVHCPRSSTGTAIVVDERLRGRVAAALGQSSQLSVEVGGGVGARVVSADSIAGRKALGQQSVLRLAVAESELSVWPPNSAQYSCELEFWSEDATGAYRSPTYGRRQTVLASVEPTVVASFTDLGPFADVGDDAQREQNLPTRPELLAAGPFEVTEPIDVVYTWVDGGDTAWLRRRAATMGEQPTWHSESASAARFAQRDELRYSLRSIHAFAPWVRDIYIVTDRQTPRWLNTNSSEVRVVDHLDVFADTDGLPVYNSHAIETQIHHLSGLSNNFLYFNDDMFLGAPIEPGSLVSAVGLPGIRFSASRVPIAEIAALDTPVDSALRNVRRLIERDFGRTVFSTSSHIPYSLRVDILYEMEDRYRGEWNRTARSRVRSREDVSPLSSFFQYYAWFTGRAFLAGIRHSYLNLASDRVAQRLERLLSAGDFQAICLNDSDARVDEEPALQAMLGAFFGGYYPLPARWESS